MFSLRYGKRPIVEESQKISAGSCVRNFLLDDTKVMPIYQKKYDLNKEEDIIEIIRNIEIGTTFNLTKDNNGEVEYSDPNYVKMTYTKSNLNRGYIFWFKCNVCSRRVKYLYFPPNSTILACRSCHRLTYDKQKESKKMRSYRSLFGV